MVDRRGPVLLEVDPARTGEWLAKRVVLYRRWYGLARADKYAVGQKLIGALMAVARADQARDKWSEAIAMYKEATTLAGRLELPDKHDIQQACDRARDMSRAFQKVLDHRKKLAENPADAETRRDLVRLLVVEMDRPLAAAEHVNEHLDDTWRTYVRLAAKPVGKIHRAACLELAEWYRGLTAEATRTGKIIVLTRACGYYQRYLSLHDRKDTAALKANLSLKAVKEQLKKLLPVEPVIRDVDLLRPVNVARHAVSGKWLKRGGALAVTTGSGGYSRITLPVVPSGSYDLKVVFVRKSGTVVAFMLPVGSSSVAFMLGYGYYPMLRYVNGSTFYDRSNHEGDITTGKQYTIAVRVALQGEDAAALGIQVNGKWALKWKGKISSLRPYSYLALPNKSTFGLGAYSNAAVLFKQAAVRMLTGTAKVVP